MAPVPKSKPRQDFPLPETQLPEYPEDKLDDVLLGFTLKRETQRMALLQELHARLQRKEGQPLKGEEEPAPSARKQRDESIRKSAGERIPKIVAGLNDEIRFNPERLPLTEAASLAQVQKQALTNLLVSQHTLYRDILVIEKVQRHNAGLLDSHPDIELPKPEIAQKLFRSAAGETALSMLRERFGEYRIETDSSLEERIKGNSSTPSIDIPLPRQVPMQMPAPPVPGKRRILQPTP